MKPVIKPISVTLHETYKRQLTVNEYSLILNPHEELQHRITRVRTEFQESFQTSFIGNSKPHVCLVRFSQLALMEERIIQRLRMIAMASSPFKVELKDFGNYPTHSIFINVISKLPIRGLVKEIRETQRLMKLDQDNKPHFVDEPNLVIGRKLLPWQFEKAWEQYSHKHFTGRFIADGMLLLKRRQGDRAWQIAEKLTFQNLPVSTKQGALFA